jgi:hypothetical protein
MKNCDAILEELCDEVANSFSKKELKKMVSDALFDEFSNLSKQDLDCYIEEYCPHLLTTSNV